MPFNLSAEAEKDVVSIAEQGIRNPEPQVAKRYHDELFAIFELIAANQRMVRERHEISPPVRIHPYKAHLVICQINEDGSIFVIRILHGHEDWAGESF